MSMHIPVTIRGLDSALGIEPELPSAEAVVIDWPTVLDTLMTNDATGEGYDLLPDAAWLTTDDPASSIGLPVLVKNGRAYGPGDIPGLVVLLTSEHGAIYGDRARRAGYAVEILPQIED